MVEWALSSLTRNADTAMNRAALLILATLTGLGSAYAAWLSLTASDVAFIGIALRVIAAIIVVGAMLITWEAAFKAPSARVLRLKRTALVVLAIGVLGLGTNALLGGLQQAPDGPLFVVSLLLILQAFLTIGYAGRSG